MLYCVASEKYPMEYISSGNLVNEDGFIHPNRNLDSWVFIVVNKGTLYISQNEQKFEVHENETLLLFPHQTHYGYQKSDGYLSYYWVHFYMADPDYAIYSRKTLLRDTALAYDSSFPLSLNALTADGASTNTGDYFILPEFSRLPVEKRTAVLFSQLLDMSKRDNYQPTWRCRYALNLLLSEFTVEFLSEGNLFNDRFPGSVKAIIEWIRVHYQEQISVASLAEHFNYSNFPHQKVC